MDRSTRSPNALPSSQTTEKATPQSSSPPPILNNVSSPRAIPNSQNSITPPDGSLPPQLQAFYTNIKRALETYFPERPPYTIQRFAELILNPTAHYRTLPAYLRALDRVLSISSTSDLFPLPVSALDSNGTGSSSVIGAVGGPSHVEEFNGAALTRIPWLRDSADLIGMDERTTGTTTDLRTESTAVIDGPNGAGSIETVTVAMNGVPSQGSSVRSVGSAGPASSIHPSTAATSMVTNAPEPSANDQNHSTVMAPSEDGNGDEIPHARGPEEIGMEDMGPQGRSGVEGSIGPAASVIAAEKAMGRPGEGERIDGSAEGRETDSAEDNTDAMSIDEADKPPPESNS